MESQLAELQNTVETVLDAWCPTSKDEEAPSIRMMRALLHLNAFMNDAKRSLAGKRPIRTDYPVPLPKGRIAELDNLIEISDKVISEVKRRSRDFVDDNLKNPHPMDYLYAENAMMIGASIVDQVRAEIS